MDGRAQPRDFVWAGIALTLAALPWLSLYDLLNRSHRDSAGTIVGSLILTTVVAFWVGLGAWRRTRWGHTSPQPAPAQFLMLEIAGLALGALVFATAKVF